MTLKKIEALLITHLAESGEIRADLKWLKRAFWSLFGVGMTGVAGLLTLGIKSIWR